MFKLNLEFVQIWNSFKHRKCHPTCSKDQTFLNMFTKNSFPFGVKLNSTNSLKDSQGKLMKLDEA